MPVHTTRFTGDTYFTNTHTAGQKIYCRSTDAANDDGTINLYGRATSGATADYVQLNPGSNEGKIEQLSSAAWSHLYLAKWDTALTGVGSVFSNDGVAAQGSVKIVTNPADSENIQIGLTGFLTTYTFKSSVSSPGQVKIGGSTAATADNLASAINDAQTGTTNPTDGTDWNSSAAHTQISATSDSGTVLFQDRVNCERQLAWVITPSDSGDFHTSAIRGGIDGTKLVDIPATSTSASTSSISGVDLDSEDLATTNASGLLTGASDSMAVRGRFVVDIRCQDPGASVAAKIQTSNDNTNWRDAVSTITDLDTDQDQIISGTDCFGEWARLYISTWSVTAAKAYNIKFISQG
jgi:hypothetical protein